MQTLGIIPARWASTRFPGKPLHPIAGKPLLQHVWERCADAERLDGVIVATDDERIAEAAEAFGARVAMTSPDHASGTDRIAEVAEAEADCSHVINIQGDEPLIDPGLIDALAARLAENPGLGMVTAAAELNPDDSALENPNVVKTVLGKDGHALYFSRSVIPYHDSESPAAPCYRHIGIYGYSRDFLLGFVRWEPSPLELSERLEQLRALENGARIAVVVTEDDAVGVDTPEQAAAVEQLLNQPTNTTLN